MNTSKNILVALTNAYSEPHRFYHTLSHIVYMFNCADTLRMELTDVEVCAIWFHDFVYNIGNKTNEEDSADVAIELCSFISNAERDTLRQLILSTKKHVPLIPMASNIINLDLMILSASREEYENYIIGIESEYRTVYSEQEYRKGRKDWLESMLSKDKIYLNMPDKLEILAKINMESELKGDFEG